MNELFDSLNPYQSMDFVSARTPGELIEKIQEAARTPIKVTDIISHNGRFVAFIMGDIRKPRRKSRKDSNNGS